MGDNGMTTYLDDPSAWRRPGKPGGSNSKVQSLENSILASTRRLLDFSESDNAIQQIER
jgi:hypothetical protein